MSVVQLLFAIVLVVGIVGAITVEQYYKNQRRNQRQYKRLEQQFDARLARVETLAERVEVLEQIVTDRRYDLNKQFRDLDKAG